MKLKDIQRESLVPILDGWVLMEGPDGTTYKIKVANFTPEGKFRKHTTSVQVGNMRENTILDGKSPQDVIILMTTRDFRQAQAHIDDFALLEKGQNNIIKVSGSITLNDVHSTQVSQKVLKKANQTWATFSTNSFSYSDTIHLTTLYWLGFDVNMPDGSMVSITTAREARCVAPTFYGVSADEFVLEAEAKEATKQIWSHEAARAITYKANSAHSFFFEPTSYGKRNRIMDQNGFNVTQAFEVVERVFTLRANTALEGQPSNAITETYYGYIKKTPAGNGTDFTYTFYNS